MDDFEYLKQKIDKQYFSSLENSLDYEKSFSRYLVIGSGAAIIFILSSYRAGGNELLSSGKFDFALWVFTFSILLSALNVYISMVLGGRYASSFLFIQKMISEHQVLHADPETTLERRKELTLEFQRNWKLLAEMPRPFQRALSMFRILAALLFAVGLIFSIFLVTNYYG